MVHFQVGFVAKSECEPKGRARTESTTEDEGLVADHEALGRGFAVNTEALRAHRPTPRNNLLAAKGMSSRWFFRRYHHFWVHWRPLEYRIAHKGTDYGRRLVSKECIDKL
jgi:hypothetical protein